MSFPASLPEAVSGTQCLAQKGAGLRRTVAWCLKRNGKATPGERSSEAAASPFPAAAGDAALPGGRFPSAV